MLNEMQNSICFLFVKDYMQVSLWEFINCFCQWCLDKYEDLTAEENQSVFWRMEKLMLRKMGTDLDSTSKCTVLSVWKLWFDVAGKGD